MVRGDAGFAALRREGEVSAAMLGAAVACGDIARLIELRCAENQDSDAVIFVELSPDGSLSEERRTYGDLRANGRKVARWLQRRGIGPGDRFALMMQNHPEFIEAMIAASYVGAAFVPVDPRSGSDKLRFMLEFTEVPLVIAADYTLDVLREIAPDLPAMREILIVGEHAPGDGGTRETMWADVLAGDDAGLGVVRAAPEAVMFLMFTSGTTGNPKAVERSHGAYMRSLGALAARGARPGDVAYTGLPLCHINAHITLAGGLAMGLPVVVSRKFTRSRLWDICRAYRVTLFALLGGMIPEIFAAPERTDDADNPVRLLICSGMSAELWERFEERFGVSITEVYGSTESGGVLINRMGEGPKGSMGKPLPGQIAEILDHDDRPCPTRVAGEICFRPVGGEAPPVTYFRDPEASHAKTRGGWFRSGDLGLRDEEGWFYFLHRSGGGVRRNGEFVNTSLVERVLASSPVVEDVFVYGIAAAGCVAGEKKLVAALVLYPGATVSELQGWAASRLQKNERPEIWQPLDTIPKTASEKPMERECAERLYLAGQVSRPARGGKNAGERKE